MLKIASILCVLTACLLRTEALPVDDFSSCTPPNDTDTAWHFWDSGGPDATVRYTGFKITNDDGSIDYPFDTNGDINLFMSQTNTGVVQPKLYVDAGLSEYKKSLFARHCEWHSLPTFGITNNLDGCKMQGDCPLQLGNTSYTVKADIKPFHTIIELLNDKIAYQLVLTLKDEHKNVIGQSHAQFKIKK